MRFKSQNLKESIAKYIFLICALTTILCFLLITFFIILKGVPGIAQIGVLNFLFGTKWEPRQSLFGILPMMLSSIFATGISFVFGSTIGKWTATYLAFFCPKKIYPIAKSMVELLAGIPSVIYGFVGVIVVVPFVRENIGGPGKSLLSAIIILTIMILPTVINISENSLRSVPKSYYEGAVALGANHNEAVFDVVVPAAKSGIVASYILAIGRALGETMAVILVAGNNPRMPFNLLKPVRTLTTGIAMEMSYASGLHQQALFGIGVVLFIFILMLNLLLARLTKSEV